MTTAAAIGKNIASLRTKNGFTQDELAERLSGYNRKNITSYETGNNFPPYDFIIQIKQLFRCSYDEILEHQTYPIGAAFQTDELFEFITRLTISEKDKSRLASEIARLSKINTDQKKAITDLKKEVLDILDRGLDRI